MIFDFVEIKTVYTIIHLFGIAIGAGGVFFSDLVFFKSIKDGKLSSTEFSFMEIGSKMIWAGLAVLVVSGVLLFSLDPDKYLSSTKFLAKVTIVAIIIANGIFLHLKFIPKFRKAAREGEMQIGEYIKSNPLLLVSGVVSMVSWSSAIILGALRGIPYSYWMILDVYVGAVLFGIVFVLLFKRKIL
jgi:uncharacterized membrane protein